MREAIHRLRVLRAWAAVLAAALLLIGGACNLDKQQPPDPVGPSDAGVSVDLVAAPDTLNADGVSQSIVRLVVRDEDGKPLANKVVLFQHDGDGYMAAAGSGFVGPVQSGLVMVTDNNGVAFVVYVAGTALRTVRVTVRPYGIDAALSFFRSIEIFQV
jgi:hypothetical protein